MIFPEGSQYFRDVLFNVFRREEKQRQDENLIGLKGKGFEGFHNGGLGQFKVGVGYSPQGMALPVFLNQAFEIILGGGIPASVADDEDAFFHEDILLEWVRVQTHFPC